MAGPIPSNLANRLATAKGRRPWTCVEVAATTTVAEAETVAGIVGGNAFRAFIARDLLPCSGGGTPNSPYGWMASGCLFPGG